MGAFFLFLRAAVFEGRPESQVSLSLISRSLHTERHSQSRFLLSTVTPVRSGVTTETSAANTEHSVTDRGRSHHAEAVR